MNRRKTPALPAVFKPIRTVWIVWTIDDQHVEPGTPGARRQRVKKGTLGAVCEHVKSDCYVADVEMPETPAQRITREKAGRPAPPRRRIKLCRNKSAAQTMLRDYVDQLEREAAGLIDYRQRTNQALGPVLDDYRRHLESKNNTAEHVTETIGKLEKVLAGCRFLRLIDLESEKAAGWLHQQRTTPRRPAPGASIRGTAKTYQAIAEAFGVSVTTVTYWRRKGAPITPRKPNDLAKIAAWRTEFLTAATMGSTTSNHYTGALRAFGRWLAKTGRTQTNPFEHVAKLSTQADRRKERRTLTNEELARLIDSAANSTKPFRGLSGLDRSMIYLLAVYTGLRAKEIASLKTDSFDFGSPAAVIVEAAYTKNADRAELPLRSDVAARLHSYLDSRPRKTLRLDRQPDTVWPGTWKSRPAEMIRLDLAAAGIPYSVDGRDFDFHALRHQFVTSLAKAGIHPKTAQELARHSKIDLTMNVYTHLTARDAIADLERLPAVPRIVNREAATGTDGPVVRQRMRQQKVGNDGPVRPRRELAAELPTTENHEKTTAKPVFPVVCESDADGTRTRNHRIDSPPPNRI